MAKVQQIKTNQFLITLPMDVAKALDVRKGDKVEFLIEQEGNFQGKNQEVRVILMQLRKVK